MEKKVLFVILTLILIGGIVHAQESGSQSGVFVAKPSSVFEKPKGFLDALLDPSRFSMSHSYSMSFSSMGGRSFNQGLYLNTMDFRFSDPLTMRLRIGYAHQPFGGGLGMNGPANGQLFLQQARIQYKPSDKVMFTLDYQQLPSSMLYPYSFYHRHR